MNNSAYWLYMAETEGLLDTHESKVQRILKDLQARRKIQGWPFRVEDGYIEKFGLTFEELSGHDLSRIAKMAEYGHL